MDMKRSLVVILAGMVATLLLISVGIHVLDTLSPDWRALASGVPRPHESLWASFTHNYENIFAFVCVPTALLVGFLVGLLCSEYKVLFGVIATSPAWVPLLSIGWEGVFGGALMASAAAFGAWLSKRVARTSGVGRQA